MALKRLSLETMNLMAEGDSLLNKENHSHLFRCGSLLPLEACIRKSRNGFFGQERSHILLFIILSFFWQGIFFPMIVVWEHSFSSFFFFCLSFLIQFCHPFLCIFFICCNFLINDKKSFFHVVLLSTSPYSVSRNVRR